MAKLTVEFKDGETASESYGDHNRLADVVAFILSGVTVKTITIEDVN